MINLFDLKSKMDENGVLLSFSGAFSQSVIEEIGEAFCLQVSNMKNHKTNTFNLFFTFVEQTQNIMNYMDNKAKEGNVDQTFLSSGIVAIGKKDSYFICAGNMVEKEDGRIVANKIESIRNKTKDELKKLHKEQLKKERDVNKRGAGLGFLDMARKSGMPIEYCLIGIDSKYDFFINIVYIE